MAEWVPVPRQTNAMTKHIHYEVLRFMEDGSLLLGASDMTGRLWNGILHRYENADYTVSNDLQVGDDLCNGIDINGDSDPKIRNRRWPMHTNSLSLESTVTDVAALTFGGNLENSPRAVVAYDSGAIEVLELGGDEITDPIFASCYNMNEHDDIVSSIGLTNDQKKLVSGSYDKSIKIWDTCKWTAVSTYLMAHGNRVLMVSCHPEDAEMFASCSQDGRVLLWDTRQPRPATVINEPSNLVPSALTWQLSSRGTRLVVGSEIGEVTLKDVRKVDTDLNRVQPLERSITRLEFEPSNYKKLAVVANGTKFVVLHLEEDIFCITYIDDIHDDFIRGAAWHPVTQNVYTCAWDGRILRHNDEPQCSTS